MKEKITKAGIYVIIFLPLLGELVRLPFGPGNGLLVADAAILLFGTWSLGTWSLETRSRLTPPVFLFIAAAALSLLQSLLFLDPPEVASGALYLIRWVFYALLYFSVYHTVKTEKDFKNIIAALSVSALLLAFLGFIQLAVYPDLEALEEEGWDPHINRLVSTWLDPNFVGGLFAFIISILTGLALHLRTLPRKIALAAAIFILTTAAYLTYSRSAWLALAAGIVTISLIKSRKLLIIGLIAILIGLSASERARDRTQELVQSVTSVFTQTAQTPDPTARLRIKSYNQTLYLIEKYPLLGVGYNNLRTVNHREGFVVSEEIHNAGGSDSSLLTILATTGIIGFIPFILIYIFALRVAWRTMRAAAREPTAAPTHQNGPLSHTINPLRQTAPIAHRAANSANPATLRADPSAANSTFRAGFALGLFGGLIALLVHSLFVNSLLYSPILVYFWIALGLNHPPEKSANQG